jgi:hypothetical protein
MSFVSFLKHVGHDFKVGLEYILPYAATAGEAGVAIFAPGLSPMFNSTVTTVIMAEQKAAALGKQDGTGAQKMADVLQLMEAVITQGLADAGMSNKQQDVVNYINSVVTILNTIPAPVRNPVPPIVPSV